MSCGNSICKYKYIERYIPTYAERVATSIHFSFRSTDKCIEPKTAIEQSFEFITDEFILIQSLYESWSVSQWLAILLHTMLAKAFGGVKSVCKVLDHNSLLLNTIIVASRKRNIRFLCHDMMCAIASVCGKTFPHKISRQRRYYAVIAPPGYSAKPGSLIFLNSIMCVLINTGFSAQLENLSPQHTKHHICVAGWIEWNIYPVSFNCIKSLGAMTLTITLQFTFWILSNSSFVQVSSS